MLVPFSVDCDALDCVQVDLSVSVAFHRRVIQEWRDYGILVHSHGKLKESSILKKIDELPQECRKLWKSAITVNKKKGSTVPWDGKFPDAQLSDLLPVSNEFTLALLEPTRAVVVGGVGIHHSSRIEPTLGGMELCKLHSVSESNCFQRAAHIAAKALNAGDICGAEWRDRYTPHLKQADQVTIVDRYILANHNWQLTNGSTSGLHRALNDCFARAKDQQVNIKVITAIQNSALPLTAAELQQVQNFQQDLAKRYVGGGIRNLDCYILTDKEFSKLAHERYMRIDYKIFGMDGGLDSFGGHQAQRHCVVWRHDTSTSRHFTQQEASLQMAAFSSKSLL